MSTAVVRNLVWPEEINLQAKQWFQILEVHCSILGSNLYGEVANAFVRLHGRLLPVTLLWCSGGFRGV